MMISNQGSSNKVGADAIGTSMERKTTTGTNNNSVMASASAKKKRKTSNEAS